MLIITNAVGDEPPKGRPSALISDVPHQLHHLRATNCFYVYRARINGINDMHIYRQIAGQRGSCLLASTTWAAHPGLIITWQSSRSSGTHSSIIESTNTEFTMSTSRRDTILCNLLCSRISDNFTKSRISLQLQHEYSSGHWCWTGRDQLSRDCRWIQSLSLNEATADVLKQCLDSSQWQFLGRRSYYFRTFVRVELVISKTAIYSQNGIGRCVDTFMAVCCLIADTHRPPDSETGWLTNQLARPRKHVPNLIRIGLVL